MVAAVEVASTAGAGAAGDAAHMLYAAKCCWPGVTPADLDHIADRAAVTGLDPGTGTLAYLGCLLSAADDLVLCLFCGPSRAAVIQASDRLGIPRARLMDSAWPAPQGRRAKGPSDDPPLDRSHHRQSAPFPASRAAW